MLHSLKSTRPKLEPGRCGSRAIVSSWASWFACEKPNGSYSEWCWMRTMLYVLAMGYHARRWNNNHNMNNTSNNWNGHFENKKTIRLHFSKRTNINTPEQSWHQQWLPHWQLLLIDVNINAHKHHVERKKHICSGIGSSDVHDKSYRC